MKEEGKGEGQEGKEKERWQNGSLGLGLAGEGAGLCKGDAGSSEQEKVPKATGGKGWKRAEPAGEGIWAGLMS